MYPDKFGRDNVVALYFTNLRLCLSESRAGLNKVARRLNIDCVPAMISWEFHGGFNHPMYDSRAKFFFRKCDWWRRQARVARSCGHEGHSAGSRLPARHYAMCIHC